MDSNTLYPAVHILGASYVYSKTKGIADRYWFQSIFFYTFIEEYSTQKRIMSQSTWKNLYPSMERGVDKAFQKKDLKKFEDKGYQFENILHNGLNKSGMKNYL